MPRKFDAPVTHTQLGAVVDEPGEVLEVQLAGVAVEPCDPALDAPAEAGQDVMGQGVPRHVVGVVLHQRRDHVVAVTELGEQRVHDCVDRLRRVAVGGDAAAAGRVDPGRDRVERLLELGRHPLRRCRLTAVDALVPRGESAVEVDELARGLGRGGVVGDHPAGGGKVEVAAEPLHVQGRLGVTSAFGAARSAPAGEEPTLEQLLAHVAVVTHRALPTSDTSHQPMLVSHRSATGHRVTLVSVGRSAVGDQQIHQDRVPTSAALVRDFVNTLDHELGTDALALALPGSPPSCSSRRCSTPRRRSTKADLAAARRLRGALARRPGAEPLAVARAPLPDLDEVLGGLPVRLAWDGDRVVAQPAQRGRRGFARPDRAGRPRGRRGRGVVAAEGLRVRRVRVGVLRPVQEPVAELLRVRLRQQAEDPRLPGPTAVGHEH